MACGSCYDSEHRNIDSDHRICVPSVDRQMGGRDKRGRTASWREHSLPGVHTVGAQPQDCVFQYRHGNFHPHLLRGGIFYKVTDGVTIYDDSRRQNMDLLQFK